MWALALILGGSLLAAIIIGSSGGGGGYSPGADQPYATQQYQIPQQEPTPSVDDMARVLATAAPTMMQQGAANAGVQSLQQGGQPLSDQQMFEAYAEPFYQAAERCGMSRQQCRAGMDEMLRDPAYAQAVRNAMGAMMLQ